MLKIVISNLLTFDVKNVLLMPLSLYLLKIIHEVKVQYSNVIKYEVISDLMKGVHINFHINILSCFKTYALAKL